MFLQFKKFLEKGGLKTSTANQYAHSIKSFLPIQLGKYNIGIKQDVSSYSLAELESLSKRLEKGGDLELIGDYGNATIRNAMKKFISFKSTQKEIEEFCGEENDKEEYFIDSFRQESDLQDFIYRNIKTIFPTYHFYKGGKEFWLDNKKRLDLILEANDKSHLLIIELKAGEIDKKAFGQISEYLVIAEKQLKKEVKGLLIGSFFAEHIPDLLKTSKYEIGIKKYTLQIELE